jgi:hypothetical protein
VKVASITVAVIVLALVGWTFFSLSCSRKGWLCKTYEGELALYVVGGVAPQIWHFSARDEQVAERLSKAVGQQVRLHYTEHKGVPTSCFAETPYFARSFEIVGRP